MPLAYITLFSGIAISVVAIYYSVLGLASIFAAAVIPILVMGTILEISKLVAAWWLKANWNRAPFLLKSYMLAAVVLLMFITSMGIFGFLSKAHTDQVIPSGDIQSQVALLDEKINNERSTIEDARRLLKQLDDAVIGIQSGEGRELKLRDGSVRQQSASEYALSIRRSQANDRAALTKTIEEAQNRIVKLQEQKAPIASQLRTIEAEVGPIKYIAKLIYGENPDQNLLEKAVVWVIILIVFVFDPLAVLLLLASQLSFQWARLDGKERKNELVQEDTEKERDREETPTAHQSDDGGTDEGDRSDTEQIVGSSEGSEYSEKKIILDESKEKLKKFMDAISDTKLGQLDSFKNIDIKIPTDVNTDHQLNAFKLSLPESQVITKEKTYETIDDLEAWNKMIEAAEKKLSEYSEEIKSKEEETNPYQSTKEDMGIGRPSLIVKSQTYVQNEEQTESNLWQESRKKVKVENEASLSQEDYQKRVHQAIIKDLIKKIDSGEIDIDALTDEEASQVEEYLKKESNDGQNNADKST
jgi:hypothetical protein